MPQGLQVFGASGSLTLDVTERLTVLVGTAYAGGSDGSLAVGALPAGDFWALVFPTIDIHWDVCTVPQVTYNGSSVVWAYPYEARPHTKSPANILYGVM